MNPSTSQSNTDLPDWLNDQSDQPAENMPLDDLISGLPEIEDVEISEPILDVPAWLDPSEQPTLDESSQTAFIPQMQLQMVEVLNQNVTDDEFENVEFTSLAQTPLPLQVDSSGWKTQYVVATVDHHSQQKTVTISFTVRNDTLYEPRKYRAGVRVPGDLPIKTSSHPARRTENWTILKTGILNPGEQCHGQITFDIPDDVRLDSPNETRARVAYQALPSPKLGISANFELTNESTLSTKTGETPTIAIRVSNSGSAASHAAHVRVIDSSSQAIVAEFTQHELLPGDHAINSLTLPACLTGWNRYCVEVSSHNRVVANAPIEVLGQLIQPRLSINCVDRLDTDGETICRIRIENPNLSAIDSISLSMTLPTSLIFRGATHDGTLNLNGDLVEWPSITILANETWEAAIKIVGFEPGATSLTVSLAGSTIESQSLIHHLKCEIRETATGTSFAEVLASFAESIPETEQSSEFISQVDIRDRHLFVKIASQRYSIPMANVREVLRPMPVIPVPGTSDWILGVANVRGDIVTIVDSSRLLGLDARGDYRAMVLMSSHRDDHTVGLAIDDILGIRAISQEELNFETGDRRLAEYISTISTDREGIVHHMNVPRILNTIEVDACMAG